MEIVSDAQGARSSRHVTSISQASDLCCQFYACLSWKPKPPAKIYLKRKYLNPKASAANLRQYAANTLPKNPAVADLVQHGEDMKSSLARPLEKLLLPWTQLANDPLHLKKLALDQKSAQIILGHDSNQLNRQPTSHRVGRQESPPRKKLSHIQAPGAAGASISQASDLCCQF